MDGGEGEVLTPQKDNYGAKTSLSLDCKVAFEQINESIE